MTHIRTATELDLVQIASIYERAVRSAPWLPDSARQQTDFAAVTAGEEIRVYCGESNVVQGFISIWKPESFVHHLYVAPQFQGQGVGTALLASLADWLALPWTLKCVDANAVALAFYLARGWKVVGSGDGEHGRYSIFEYSGEPADEREPG